MFILLFALSAAVQAFDGHATFDRHATFLKRVSSPDGTASDARLEQFDPEAMRAFLERQMDAVMARHPGCFARKRFSSSGVFQAHTIEDDSEDEDDEEQSSGRRGTEETVLFEGTVGKSQSPLSVGQVGDGDAFPVSDGDVEHGREDGEVLRETSPASSVGSLARGCSDRSTQTPVNVIDRLWDMLSQCRSLESRARAVAQFVRTYSWHDDLSRAQAIALEFFRVKGLSPEGIFDEDGKFTDDFIRYATQVEWTEAFGDPFVEGFDIF